MSRPFWLLGILAALGSCASAPVPDGDRAYTLILLKTGPKSGHTQEERRAAFAGHFANMERLAKEKNLLLAGPYGQARHDPALRGIFVLDTADRGRARGLAETDPAFQAGIFALEYHELRTAAPLGILLDAGLAAQAAAEKDGRKPAPGEGGRGYALLTFEDGPAARRQLAGRPDVLLLGDLDRTGALAVIDAPDAAAARERLAGIAGDLGTFTCDDWFATGRLSTLPALAAGPPGSR